MCFLLQVSVEIYLLRWIKRMSFVICKGLNRVGVSHHSLEDKSKFSFRNVVFFGMSDDGRGRKTP
jgi:hypothetical protein